MSVIVTLRVNGNPQELERYAAENPGKMAAIIEQAKAHGVIAHRFYGSEDGKLMVIDEWPDAASFQAFFTESEAEIGPMMQAVGVTTEPEVSFWNELETGDAIGWGA